MYVYRAPIFIVNLERVPWYDNGNNDTTTKFSVNFLPLEEEIEKKIGPIILRCETQFCVAQMRVRM